MPGRSFNQALKRLRGLSRADIVRALVFAATAIPLTPVRIARHRSSDARGAMRR
jgi:hypothetical protein